MALHIFRHRQALAQPALSQQIVRSFTQSAETGVLQQTNQKVVPKPSDNRTTIGGQAFPDDLRSESGLGLGDGLHDHTSKWKQVRFASAFCWAASSVCPRQRTLCSLTASLSAAG